MYLKIKAINLKLVTSAIFNFDFLKATCLFLKCYINYPITIGHLFQRYGQFNTHRQLLAQFLKFTIGSDPSLSPISQASQ